MRNHLKRYKVELTVLGPVFIGNGEEIKKSEWIRSGESVYIMDQRKLVSMLESTGKLESYIRSMVKNGFSLEYWPRENKISSRSLIGAASYCLDISSVYNDTLKKSNIKAFIKDPYGKPYIPGSSIKGVIRNVLAGAKIVENGYPSGSVKEEIRSFQGNSKKFLRNQSSKLEKEIFHTSIKDGTKREDAVNDTMRGIRFSDSEPIDLDCLTLCQKVDVKTDGSDGNLNVIREVLKPGTKVKFVMTIDQSETDITANEILNSTDSFYDDYRTMFLDNFNNYEGAEEELSLKGEHIVFLGGGVGYPSKTVMNQILKGDERRIYYVGAAIQTALTGGRPPHGKMKKIITHDQDENIGASPRVLKMTEYDGRLMQMGACEIGIEEL